MIDLSGKRILVTGSTKGIGRGIATAFVARRAEVVVHGRNAEEVRSVVAAIGAAGGCVGDLGSAEGCATVLEQAGAVEVLVNNAGIFGVQDFFAIDDEEWHRYFQINVMSMVRLCRALLPGMLERDTGCIVNVASEAGMRGLGQMIHYSVSKTAIIGLSRGLAELTKGTNVRVNSLLPGPTWTEGVEEYFAGLARQEGKSADEVIADYFRVHEPTSLSQRMGTVEEVASGAVFLAENSGVNGSALRVEGGIIRCL